MPTMKTPQLSWVPSKKQTNILSTKPEAAPPCQVKQISSPWNGSHLELLWVRCVWLATRYFNLIEEARKKYFLCRPPSWCVRPKISAPKQIFHAPTSSGARRRQQFGKWREEFLELNHMGNDKPDARPIPALITSRAARLASTDN